MVWIFDRHGRGGSRRNAVVSTALLLLPLGGCVGASFIPTTAAVHPAREPGCAVEVYSTMLPERDYEEIGLVEGEGTLWKSDLDDVLPELREEACRAGGDAIILGSEQKYVRGEDNEPVLWSVATVIRWR